jgi:hypothetical protein
MKPICIAILSVATFVPTTVILRAQSSPPAAPLPSAILKAQKLFLSNAGDTDNQDCLHAYNELYAGLVSDGRFQLVLEPSNADLILELHYEIRPVSLGVGKYSGDGVFTRQFRLVLIDPRTRTVLWSLSEVEDNAILQSNRDKNLDSAVAQLLTDFKTIGQPKPPKSPGKTRYSEEKP